MQRPLSRSLGLAGFLSLALLATPSQAQDRSERVKFDTIDGVELRGNFYPGKRNAPVVILLHDYESNSRTKDWIRLAEALQKSPTGYAVLAFDFRGHGESTIVQPGVFWNHAPNRAGIRRFKADRDTIEFKDFTPQYRTVLINDIAAAKAYLDRKNDTGACNTGATIVVGAEQGATLGAIWLNSETFRYRTIPDMFNRVVFNNEPEARDVCACLWLSISPKLGSQSVNVGKTLYSAAKGYEIPMVFMYGDGDVTGKKVATQSVSYLKGKDKAGLKFTGAIAIKGTKLSGTGLLKSADTTKEVVRWLDEAHLAKGNEWGKREFRTTQYYWRYPARVVPAKIIPTEMNMAFDTYVQFKQ